MRKLDRWALDWFLYFIEERHTIYQRRSAGHKFPWTDDILLRKYKFTNIFRELDTGTIWLRENIRESYADDPELFFNVAMYRLYNLISTAQELLDKVGYIHNYREQCDDVVRVIRERRNRGDNIFTGVYMLTGTLGGDKICQVFEKCLLPLWDNRDKLVPQPGDTLEKAFNRINSKTPGYGPFIAYEVVTDLRHTRYLNNASDIMTWANPGPGAKRGIYRLLGLSVKKGISMRGYPSVGECIELMRRLLYIIDSIYIPLPAMEMRDVEHSLCEWDKYMRALLKEGRPRSKYVPQV